MKWKINRKQNVLQVSHSFYSIRFEKILPKGSFSIELYRDGEIRVQRIGKNFRVAFMHFNQFKRLIKKGF